MAFVGNLFSCGRARKAPTRDETNITGSDATRREVTSDPASGGDIRATPNSGLDDRHVKTPLSGRATPAPFPEEEDDEPEPSAGRRLNDFITSRDVAAIPESKEALKEQPPARVERIERLSEDHRRASKGWQIEQRILVTTSRPTTGDASSAQQASPEPGVHHAALASPVATAKLQVQEPASPRRSLDDKESDVESLERPEVAGHAMHEKIPDNKDEEAEKITETSAAQEVEVRAPHMSMVDDSSSTTQEVNSPSSSTSAPEESVEAEALATAAKAQLLNLPAGM